MVILGLGSNIGDRLAHLRDAVRCLSVVLGDIRLSRIVESPAMLPPDAPEGWGHPFLNMAASGITDLAPQALLAAIKAIERDLGRVARGKWSPREIDIDILAMDNIALNTPELAIPHRELLYRDFALLPLADIAPSWRYPGGAYDGWTAVDIAADKGFSFGPTLRNTGLTVNA